MSSRPENTNEGNNKNESVTRQRYVQNVKTEMIFFNFGLPSNPKYVNLGWEDVVPKIRALHELQVRLNVYLSNGKSQSGKIEYPEAHRIIQYNFEENTDKSYVRFYSTRNEQK